MKKTYFIVFLISMLVFLLTCWTAKFTVYAAGWAESLSYFVLTFVVLRKYAKPDTYGWPFVLSIVLGRLLLEVPVRILDFNGSLFSMFVPMIVVVSILLGAVYFRERRNSVLVLAVIVLILLNTTAHDAWLYKILDMTRN